MISVVFCISRRVKSVGIKRQARLRRVQYIHFPIVPRTFIPDIRNYNRMQEQLLEIVPKKIIFFLFQMLMTTTSHTIHVSPSQISCWSKKYGRCQKPFSPLKHFLFRGRAVDEIFDHTFGLLCMQRGARTGAGQRAFPPAIFLAVSAG